MVSISRTANPAGVSASTNVATYSTVSIGTAAPNRIIVVAVASELASTPINSCTIDYGSGDTAMTSAAGLAGNFGAVYARLFWLLVPTGTTATIKVTFGTNSPTSTQNHIAVYSVLDAVYSTGGNDGSTDMDATDPLTTGSTTIASGGGMLAVAGGATDTAGKTWSNLTEDIDADAGALRFTTAYSTTAGTATRTCTGATNGEDGAMSWIIFADNSSPTTALNSPADTATGQSTTPTLNFTGTDADSDAVEYEVQVSTTTFADITKVQSKISHSTTLAFDSSVTSGNTIIVGLVDWDNSIGASVLSDNQSNTYTRVVFNNPGAAAANIAIFVAENVTGGSITVTYSNSGSTPTMGILEYSGIILSSSADQTNTHDDTDTIVTTGSVTTTINGELYIGLTGNDVSTDGGVTFTVSSPFTKQLEDVNGSSSQTFCLADLITVAGSYETTFTLNGSFASHSVIATFKPKTILIDALSASDAGFTAGHPFASGVAKEYTVQSALSNSTLYYWRVRATDPTGSNEWGAWATTRSFTTGAGGGSSIKTIFGLAYASVKTVNGIAIASVKTVEGLT